MPRPVDPGFYGFCLTCPRPLRWLDWFCNERQCAACRDTRVRWGA